MVGQASSGEPGDDRVDIGGIEGPRKPIHQFLLGGGVRRRGRLPLPRHRLLSLEGGAGALERAGHLLLAGVERPGDLTGLESQHVAQIEGGARAGTATAAAR